MICFRPFLLVWIQMFERFHHIRFWIFINLSNFHMRSERSERYYILRLFLLFAHSLRSLRRFRRSILTAVMLDTPPLFSPFLPYGYISLPSIVSDFYR
jgi:hypothetical protein